MPPTTLVSRNLVSFFDQSKALTEATTALKLKLLAREGSDCHPPAAELNTNLEFGQWQFPQTDDRHKSFDLLSGKDYSFRAKSLELCTENLGSETGTDVIAGSIFSSSSSSENPPPHGRAELEKSKQEVESPGNPHRDEAKNFPPPLTTISGPSALQVRRRREGGRLVIEALEAPARSSCLLAERGDGRLRLCLLTGSAASSGGEEEEGGDECGGEMEMNSEMEVEKFQRLRMCNGSGNHGSTTGLCSKWKPPPLSLWVATA